MEHQRNTTNEPGGHKTCFPGPYRPRTRLICSTASMR
jgi:hypothetical protein